MVSLVWEESQTCLSRLALLVDPSKVGVALVSDQQTKGACVVAGAVLDSCAVVGQLQLLPLALGHVPGRQSKHNPTASVQQLHTQRESEKQSEL